MEEARLLVQTLTHGTVMEALAGMPGASIQYHPAFIDAASSQQLFQQLSHELQWNQGSIQLFGKRHLIPRLEAWHGDPGTNYSYSGTELSPHCWTPSLERIRHQLGEFRSDLQFNAVLGNLYRGGEDAMGWHSDDEPELGPEPVIASLKCEGLLSEAQESQGSGYDPDQAGSGFAADHGGQDPAQLGALDSQAQGKERTGGTDQSDLPDHPQRSGQR